MPQRKYLCVWQGKVHKPSGIYWVSVVAEYVKKLQKYKELMWLYKILNLYPQNLTHLEVCWIVWRGKNQQQLLFEVREQISTITTQNKPVHWAHLLLSWFSSWGQIYMVRVNAYVLSCMHVYVCVCQKTTSSLISSGETCSFDTRSCPGTQQLSPRAI